MYHILCLEFKLETKKRFFVWDFFLKLFSDNLKKFHLRLGSNSISLTKQFDYLWQNNLITFDKIKLDKAYLCFSFCFCLLKLLKPICFNNVINILPNMKFIVKLHYYFTNFICKLLFCIINYVWQNLSLNLLLENL